VLLVKFELEQLKYMVELVIILPKYFSFIPSKIGFPKVSVMF